jgi:ankyrin repeat protein
VRNGAEIRARTSKGLGVMHLAAQAENVYALTYFRDRGISINDLDDEKCTPLHWAVISK